MVEIQRGLWSVTMNTGLCASSSPPNSANSHRPPTPPSRVLGSITQTQRWKLHNLLTGSQTDLNEEKWPKIFDPFEVGAVHFCKLLVKNIWSGPFAKKVVILMYAAHKNKHTDSFCTFPMKSFQQMLVIRGGDRARVSEDSQWAARQWGAIWKPRPHVKPHLWYCLPAVWRHRGVFNEHYSPAGCLKVGLSIHSFLMTLCITSRLLTARSEPEWRGQSLQIEFLLKIDS